MQTDNGLSRALEIIRRYEGLKLEAYVPPEGDKNGLAIGYGYTRPWVRPGCRISEEWAEHLLREHVEGVNADVARALTGCPHTLTDNQLAAILSLVYNIGIGAFRTSAMRQLLLNGRFTEAAAEFPKWRKSNGKVLPGLVKRRKEEMELFLKKEE